jgi:murein DD-endopeptidase MepM/ murein hydrolase activator NlpD
MPKRLIVVILFLLSGVGYLALRFYSASQSNSIPPIRRWFEEPASRAELATVMDGAACPGAPFILPSDGFIGLLWNDPAGPYTVLNTHTGIDIFGDGAPGEVPVYAAYDGYLTRLFDWLSSVIIRHDDPLQPGRAIWTYYTHMASRDGTQSFIVDEFPPGTSNVWVERGTLLGYQGEYAGSSPAGIGLHLHFSIVLSEPDGSFKNEARIGNTLDPSPYLGMPLDIAGLPERPVRCNG